LTLRAFNAKIKLLLFAYLLYFRQHYGKFKN
jgi:hypothetical protein